MNPLPLREISLFGAIVTNDAVLLKEQMYHTEQVNIDATPSLATCRYFLTDNSNINNQTPLQVAIMMNRPSIIKTLTTLQDTRFTDQLKSTIPSTSLARFSKSIINTVLSFLKTKVSIDQNNDGWTALMFATLHNPTAIPALIESGADVNLQSIKGTTALMFAAQHNPTAIPALIASGADVNLQNNKGTTALMFAAQHSPTAIPAFVAAGADVNLRGTALMYDALSNPSLDCGRC